MLLLNNAPNLFDKCFLGLNLVVSISFFMQGINMRIYCILLMGLSFAMGQLIFTVPADTAKFFIKNKEMSQKIAGFSKPIYDDDQYFNVNDDDSYDSWEPTNLLRDSASLFAYTKIWGKAFDAAVLKSWYAPSRIIQSSIEQSVTWIGHSTFLIQVKNLNIITDPVFGSPSWFYPRSMSPGISLNRLPRIDVILLSHNHADHMDEDSLMSLRMYQPLVMVPMGNAAWFIENGFNRVIEYTWWERQELVLKNDLGKLDITCVPAVHWSGRSLVDTNETLWSGWVISVEGQSIYFAGDTGYRRRQFEEIRALFPSITLALLPIGPNEPSKLLDTIHMNATQAVEAFLDLGAQWFIPMHWGTFRFGVDTFISPIERLQKAWQENKIPENKLHILKVGQRLAYSKS